MARNDTAKTGKSDFGNHEARFSPALDSRKRKIRGLWRRGKRFYAQMRIETGNGSTRPVRVPLEARTLDEARAELEKRRTQNRAGSMHKPGYRPKFEKLAEDYMASAEFLAKKPGTRENEKQALKRWSKHLGGVRIDWIKTSHIAAFRNARKKQGVTPRTINLDCVAFNNAMKYAVDCELLSSPPRLKKLGETPPKKRPLLSPADVARLISFCSPKITKNAELLRAFIQFLALTGAREQEAIKTKKSAVDLLGARLTIGADGDTKNNESRIVNMSPELHAMLSEWMPKVDPESAHLFPSPRRKECDRPAKTLRESFRAVRVAAGLPWVGFHDFRHFFISTCVMAGIDFMTIASWVGHKDGGILIGKVYGHLSDEHKRNAAKKLTILGGRT